jgi:hypothetical protein
MKTRPTLPAVAVLSWILFLAGLTGPAAAGSIDEQVEVVLLAVSYQKVDVPEYIIAIVHDQNASDWSLRKVDRAMRKSRSFRKKKLKTVKIPMADTEILGKQLVESKANAVFIMADTQLENAKKIVQLTHRLKILSIAGEPDHVDQAGATLGVRKTGRGFKILINHKGRAEEGVIFDTRLLRMAAQ